MFKELSKQSFLIYKNAIENEGEHISVDISEIKMCKNYQQYTSFPKHFIFSLHSVIRIEYQTVKYGHMHFLSYKTELL